MKRSDPVSFWARILILALFAALFTPFSARADVAPPQQPPGTNIVPGSESTQVRMLAETVTLKVLSTPSPRYPGQAKTEALFIMRNLGSVEESMDVRFPLTFWDNESDGFGRFPEIPDIQIQVDGKTVSTHRIEADFANPGGGIAHNQAPWAAFSVRFPPGKDVIIAVKYTANGYGLDPYFTLRYILETGAGWNGTIGSADIIVQLPYEASLKNVLLNEPFGLPQANAKAKFDGQEVRWHFEDFEPTSDDNIQVTLVQTATWQNVLDYTEYVRKYPNDGEGWGQLGKAYKQVVLPAGNKGYFRADPIDPTASPDLAGREMYQLSIQAYDKAVTLLPNDALWHYGFADLFWRHLHWRNFDNPGDSQGMPELVRAVDELRKSLALDPKNQDAKDLARWIGSQLPWALSETDKGFDYLILTATPTLAPDVSTPLPEPSSTPEPLILPTLTATPAMEAIPPRPTNVPPGLPFCGGAALLLPVLAGLVWLIAKRH